VRQMQGGAGRSGSFSAGAPAGGAGAHGAGQAPEADIAALATRLIMQSHGTVVAETDVHELERAVLALVQATHALRRYPLRNSDEPMTVNGRGPGEGA
jgi:hypothetical protein